jgi:gamma-glutamylcyclotransferase (GGCT)/AIG2-like uncharacterized protein YtfP
MKQAANFARRECRAGPCPVSVPLLPVFVYGTLRPGQAGFAELALADRVDCLGPAAVAGRLHNLGDYTAVTLGGGDLVHGELLMLRDSALLSRLDAYENYDALRRHESEYLRVTVLTIEQPRPLPITVWIYVYNRPLDPASRIIRGDWTGC